MQGIKLKLFPITWMLSFPKIWNIFRTIVLNFAPTLDN